MKEGALTEREKAFVRFVFEGLSQREAYRRAYAARKLKDSTCDVNACRLLKNAKVRAYLAELNAQVDRQRVMDKQERMEWLSRVVRTPVGKVDEGSDLCQEATASEMGVKVKMPGKIEAIRELNRMDGAYEPEQIEVRSELSFGSLLKGLESSALVRGRKGTGGNKRDE
ncbi:terminase small subunit [Akkermansia glycaniphila]|uniref:Terminase small subunit n=2 Tax=Akkermansia glycaniphila TaxID=1679444 RepID=A0A1H6MGI6_9BACT|nr:terminase small subunit [Akkermansia glycaniphila]SEH97423.1 terminase small subunit [Akkermansia glycaniphila]